MTAVNGFPLMLNQEVPLGHGYAAEAFRAEHYDATSGGNGVGSPTALKVSAQPAPDGTIRTNPGGATLRSTYAGQDGQSYHAYFGPRTRPVSPTGSSAGGRTDLVVAQICDPEHDLHWSYEGEYPIPADTAKDMEFQRIHVFEGLDRTASLDFPHTLLAEINRPPNTTIVTNSHITDLRVLANPKSLLHMRAANLNGADAHWAIDNINVWPRKATHTMHIPEFATRMHVAATWGTVRAPQAGSDGVAPSGTVQVRFTHPDGDTLFTQASNWNANGEQMERLNIVLGDIRVLPAKWRGVDVVVDMLGRARSPGPNVWMDGGSSFVLQMFFEQGVA